MGEEKEIPKTLDDCRFLLEQYQILSERRVNHNTLLWQSPIMFFTAQAFLYIIALGNDPSYPWWSRFIAAFISFLFSLLTVIQFKKCRAMEVADAEQLLDIENSLIAGYKHTGQTIHSVQCERTYLNKSLVWEKQLQNGNFSKIDKISSYGLWVDSFLLTAFVSAFVLIYTLARCFPAFTHFSHQINLYTKAVAIASLFLDVLPIFIRKAYKSLFHYNAALKRQLLKNSTANSGALKNLALEVAAQKRHLKAVNILFAFLWAGHNLLLLLLLINAGVGLNITILTILFSDIVSFTRLLFPFIQRWKAGKLPESAS